MMYNKTNKQDILITQDENKGTVVKLINLKASNVIGNGGWKVTVSGAFTADLNFNTELKALEAYNEMLIKVVTL